MKLSKQQLKTSTHHYIKKCAGAVCTSKLHESARNSYGHKPHIAFFLLHSWLFDKHHWITSKS